MKCKNGTPPSTQQELWWSSPGWERMRKCFAVKMYKLWFYSFACHFCRSFCVCYKHKNRYARIYHAGISAQFNYVIGNGTESGQRAVVCRWHRSLALENISFWFALRARLVRWLKRSQKKKFSPSYKSQLSQNVPASASLPSSACRSLAEREIGMEMERVEWVREQLNELKQRKRSENVTYVVKGIIRFEIMLWTLKWACARACVCEWMWLQCTVHVITMS